MPTISGLFLYPVKSCRGIAVAQADLDERGLVGDRRFLVVDPAGRFLTQRSHPAMARVATALTDELLTLSAAGHGEVHVPRAPDPAAPLMGVQVWSDEGLQSEHCGPVAAAWLSAVLATPAILVRLGPAFQRPVTKSAALPGDQVSFADAAPLLLTAESSLRQLGDRLLEAGSEPVAMDRFRPNLVVAGTPAFDEDHWAQLRTGAGIELRAAGPCDRCTITTTDQHTGERGREPLRTLASFRRDPVDRSRVNFGLNLINASKHGTLRVGDHVEIARAGH